MKKFLLASACALAFSSQAMAVDPYIEGQVGFVGVSDVDTNQYSGTSGGYTFTNLKSTFEYDNSMAFGAEVGLKGVGADNIRLGLGYTRFEAEADSATLSGSVTDGTTTWTGPLTTRDRALLKNFDNTVNLYSLNAYFDIDTGTDITPYLGAGVGLADIENAKDIEAAMVLAAGVNYDLTEKAYVGLKGNYYRVAGPKDKLGIEFDTIQAYSIMATVGFRF